MSKMITLAQKWRPKEFTDVVGQDVCTTILKKQIDNETYSHAILFAGNAGCGKTTCARIFANKIDGEIIELDCASHNGVADIKEIVENARVKSLLHKYKCFILDECHTLSSAAWASLLIILEENLPNSIFIFCTTDTQKIPMTIISRVQRFNFLPIIDNVMLDRLKYICNKENISISNEALDYIIKSAKGSLRQALTNLDKCLLYGNLSINSICKVLNLVTIDIMNSLYIAYNNKNINEIIKLVEDIYNNGYELHEFIKQFLDYCVTKNNFELIERLLIIINEIKYDDTPKNIIIARFII